MRQGELAALLAKVKDDGSDTLDLSREELEYLPPEIGDLVHLVELDLTGNQLKELPAEIGNLTNLTRLNARNNQLTKLPSELGGLVNLKGLFLQENQLTELPLQVGQLGKNGLLVMTLSTEYFYHMFCYN